MRHGAYGGTSCRFRSCLTQTTNKPLCVCGCKGLTCFPRWMQAKLKLVAPERSTLTAQMLGSQLRALPALGAQSLPGATLFQIQVRCLETIMLIYTNVRGWELPCWHRPGGAQHTATSCIRSTSSQVVQPPTLHYTSHERVVGEDEPQISQPSWLKLQH